jgi:hypothetical protein
VASCRDGRACRGVWLDGSEEAPRVSSHLQRVVKRAVDIVLPNIMRFWMECAKRYGLLLDWNRCALVPIATGENTMRIAVTVAVVVLFGALAPAQAQQGATLEKSKRNGFVSCGTSEGVPGFSLPDQAGVWTGFDID